MLCWKFPKNIKTLFITWYYIEYLARDSIALKAASAFLLFPCRRHFEQESGVPSTLPCCSSWDRNDDAPRAESWNSVIHRCAPRFPSVRRSRSNVLFAIDVLCCPTPMIIVKTVPGSFLWHWMRTPFWFCDCSWLIFNKGEGFVPSGGHHMCNIVTSADFLWMSSFCR